MTIKKGDFVKINYTGTTEGTLFDTTVEATGKAAGINKSSYAPVTICVGEGHLIPGIDNALVGKEKGSFKISFEPEQGFGKKDPKLLQLTPLQQFKKQNINPFPGMELNVDGSYGVVKTINGGRVIVDYNHPLAGKNLDYEIEVIDLITDVKEQVTSLLDIVGLPYDKIDIEKDHAIITSKTMLPQEFMNILQEKITSLTSIKTVSFQNGDKPVKVEKKEIKQ